MTLQAHVDHAVPGSMKKTFSVGLAAVLFALASTTVACGGGSGDDSGGLLDNNTGMATNVASAVDSGVSELAEEGDPCTDPGAQLICHDSALVIDGFKYCDGNRTCDPTTSTWGPCINGLLAGPDGG
jgi:hypothetical protein